MIRHYPYYAEVEGRDCYVRMPQSIFLETSKEQDYVFARNCVERLAKKESRIVRNEFTPVSDDFIFATLVYFYEYKAFRLL